MVVGVEMEVFFYFIDDVLLKTKPKTTPSLPVEVVVVVDIDSYLIIIIIIN